MRIISSGVLMAALMAVPAAAQEMDGWSGEGAVSAAITSGNTDTKDIGIGLKIANKNDGWRTSGAFTYDFGDNSGVESRNRWSLAGQVDHDITPRLYGYARGAYEEDKFSGFESRLFIGGGLGFKTFASPATTWKIEGGPGYRRDVFAAPAFRATISARVQLPTSRINSMTLSRLPTIPSGPTATCHRSS